MSICGANPTQLSTWTGFSAFYLELDWMKSSMKHPTETCIVHCRWEKRAGWGWMLAWIRRRRRRRVLSICSMCELISVCVLRVFLRKCAASPSVPDEEPGKDMEWVEEVEQVTNYLNTNSLAKVICQKETVGKFNIYFHWVSFLIKIDILIVS